MIYIVCTGRYANEFKAAFSTYPKAIEFLRLHFDRVEERGVSTQWRDAMEVHCYDVNGKLVEIATIHTVIVDEPVS